MTNNKPPIRIESICIVHKDDDNPIEKGMDKIGIFVEAEVSYPITVFRISDQKYQEHRRIETLKSSGLWGILSDAEYGEKVLWEQEQLKDLKNHLSVFGVDVSNFYEVRVQMRRE